MKRREFVGTLGIGSAGVATAAVLGSRLSAAPEEQHDHTQVGGPLAQATVSFGQWRTDLVPALDRYPNNNPRTANSHKQIPYTVTIKAGGAVNFLISGTHQMLVYAPGTTLASISRNVVDAVPGQPPFPGFVDDPVNRIYRGPDPRPLPQDRAESVTFAATGTYLVVCGLVPHFDEGMHGFVKVV
jgi:plastocyanin